MSETYLAAGILSLGAALCFRIAWEEYRWPSKPTHPDREGKGGERP